jgi:hypothetical protein
MIGFVLISPKQTLDSFKMEAGQEIQQVKVHVWGL